MGRSVLKAAVVIAGLAVLLVVALTGSRSRSADRSDTGPGRAGGITPQASLASIWEKPGEDPHEAKILEHALLKKPGHTPVLMRLADVAAKSGRPAEAQKYLREVLQQEPGNSEARLELGKALFETGDVARAIEETGRILEQDPNHADALYNLGAIYGNVGNRALALRYWTRLLEAAPDSDSGKRAGQLIGQLRTVSR